MKVTAKCHNYSGCLLAYRGQEISLDGGAPLACPECGKPVTVLQTAASKWIGALLALCILGVIGAGAYLWLDRHKAGTTSVSSTPEPVSAAPTAAPGTPAAESPRLSPPPATPREDHSAPPPEKVVAAPLDFDPAKAENRKVKTEVLTRIDLMPNLSKTSKDKLYNSVERARSMGKLLTIPFGSGKTAIAPADFEALRTALETPEIRKLRDDPTAVFVILGYADSRGDEKKNLAVSQARADGVLAAMRDRCNVQNVMHTVAMGSSTMLDPQSLEKNRIVEIWAVVP
ncbi:MAG: hypothetical protein M3463_02985 [Verrucomicrobiota bacterium]|nr:hypothetical protein [Verrucomicrobiota bacterium]